MNGCNDTFFHVLSGLTTHPSINFSLFFPSSSTLVAPAAVLRQQVFAFDNSVPLSQLPLGINGAGQGGGVSGAGQPPSGPGE